MRRTGLMRSAAPVAAVLAALLMTSACGDTKVTPDETKSDAGDDASASPTAEPVDTSTADGDWLLAMQTAGGADAETSGTYYVTYNPATGQARARKMPGVRGASASPEQAALLVSADRRWAITDTEISAGDRSSGKLEVYSLTSNGTKVIDLRQRTGDDGVRALGWAFDPNRPDTLRVVDSDKRVWAVKVSGGKATAEAPLAKGPWEFINGFNPNTGEPYAESITGDATKPAGNGVADTSALTRDGGTVLPGGSAGLTELPPSPCRLGAGFTDADGVTWVFCADKPTITTYYLAEGDEEWTAYGKPSAAVAPEVATFPLVLPPAA
jgi:hypothetical protein